MKRGIFIMQNINGRFRTKKINFTQVSNEALRDPSLSLKAKGLYSLIQSYITIPNFIVYKSFLIKQCTEKETAFKTAWKELKSSGYLLQYKFKDEKGFFYYEYDLVESPTNEVILLKTPGCENPPVENPPGGSSTGGKNTPYNKTDLNNTDVSNTKSVSPSKSINKIDRPTDFTAPDNQALVLIKENITIVELQEMHPQDRELIQEIDTNIDLMFYSEELMVNKQPKPQTLVRSMLNKLTLFHVEDVLLRFKEHSKNNKIKNTQAYLQVLLFNAPAEMSSSIKNSVLYHMH